MPTVTELRNSGSWIFAEDRASVFPSPSSTECGPPALQSPGSKSTSSVSGKALILLCEAYLDLSQRGEPGILVEAYQVTVTVVTPQGLAPSHSPGEWVALYPY